MQIVEDEHRPVSKTWLSSTHTWPVLVPVGRRCVLKEGSLHACLLSTVQLSLLRSRAVMMGWRGVICLVLSLCLFETWRWWLWCWRQGEALTAPEPKPLSWSSDQVQCRGPQDSSGSGIHTYVMDWVFLIHCLLLVMSLLEIFFSFLSKV